MYEAVKNLNRLKPKQHLLLQNEHGLTANEEGQTKIIAKYFQNTFFNNNLPFPNIPPSPMLHPFTTEEIKSAVGKMKNNKSPGNDGINAELIKHSPDLLYHRIADIYNDISKTSEHPNELIHGLLRALQKPGKQKGPPSNLRPIILLSILRKILAICIMKRIGCRIDAKIPISQAAYRKNRSTTEHVFGTKLIIERTISSKNETVHLILLDMSKAFDSIHCVTLIKEL